MRGPVVLPAQLKRSPLFTAVRVYGGAGTEVFFFFFFYGKKKECPLSSSISMQPSPTNMQKFNAGMQTQRYFCLSLFPSGLVSLKNSLCTVCVCVCVRVCPPIEQVCSVCLREKKATFHCSHRRFNFAPLTFTQLFSRSRLGPSACVSAVPDRPSKAGSPDRWAPPDYQALLRAKQTSLPSLLLFFYFLFFLDYGCSCHFSLLKMYTNRDRGSIRTLNWTKIALNYLTFW